MEGVVGSDRWTGLGWIKFLVEFIVTEVSRKGLVGSVFIGE